MFNLLCITRTFLKSFAKVRTHNSGGSYMLQGRQGGTCRPNILKLSHKNAIKPNFSKNHPILPHQYCKCRTNVQTKATPLPRSNSSLRATFQIIPGFDKIVDWISTNGRRNSNIRKRNGDFGGICPRLFIWRISFGQIQSQLHYAADFASFGIHAHHCSLDWFWLGHWHGLHHHWRLHCHSYDWWVQKNSNKIFSVQKKRVFPCICRVCSTLG